MFCKLKPGFFVVVSTYVNPDETPRMLSPAKLRVSKSSEGAPGAPGYGRTWVHLIAFSRCGPKFFFRFFTSHTHLAESTKKAHPLSLASSTARRGAVRCRAVSCPAVRCRAEPCCAVLCRAVPCFLFRTCQTTTLASRQSGREPASPRRSSIL